MYSYFAVCFEEGSFSLPISSLNHMDRPRPGFSLTFAMCLEEGYYFLPLSSLSHTKWPRAGHILTFALCLEQGSFSLPISSVTLTYLDQDIPSLPCALEKDLFPPSVLTQSHWSIQTRTFSSLDRLVNLVESVISEQTPSLRFHCRNTSWSGVTVSVNDESRKKRTETEKSK